MTDWKKLALITTLAGSMLIDVHVSRPVTSAMEIENEYADAFASEALELGGIRSITLSWRAIIRLIARITKWTAAFLLAVGSVLKKIPKPEHYE